MWKQLAAVAVAVCLVLWLLLDNPKIDGNWVAMAAPIDYHSHSYNYN
jgi:hypothetical protein